MNACLEARRILGLDVPVQTLTASPESPIIT